jgi:uncharacterized protein
VSISSHDAASAAVVDTPDVGPIQGKERFTSIDVVRGIALFGILLMNIVGFGHGMWIQEFQPEGAAQGANFWVWVIENTFFEGTQRTLFSLLFGAGVIILTSRAEQRGGHAQIADIYYRRNIWLIAFGLVNSYLLLWDGDILYFYGIAALFLFPLRNMKPKHLIMIGILGMAVLVAERQYDNHVTFGKHADYLEAQAILDGGEELDEEQQEALDGWNSKLEDFNYNADDLRESIEAHTGSYGTVFMRHLPGLTDAHGNVAYRYLVLDAFCIMVIGMAFLKLGVLTLQRPSRFYWLMVFVGYGIGLPVSAWETNHIVTNDFSMMAWLDTGATYDLGRFLNALGHLGLLLLFVRSGWLPSLQERLAAVGRMALTNYIMHSVIAAFIFLGFGFGLYGNFERYELYYVVALICLFQLLISKPWLDRYRFGPLEWLWRSLTYLKAQPMLRAGGIDSRSIAKQAASLAGES